jgi:D-beta-D-heptose 7-phosphate kinase/D-beta-D-heptose 1-phosphate adenosyltransferase
MIVHYKDLANIRSQHLGRKIVFSDGVFDLFHIGHLEHLKYLRQLGDLIVVGIMSDEWVRMTKGDKRPVMGEEERLHVVDSVRYIDYAVLLDDFEKKERVRTTEALDLLRPDIFATSDSAWGQHKEKFEHLGVELKIVERITPKIVTRVENISTSGLIKRIQDLNEE